MEIDIIKIIIGILGIIVSIVFLYFSIMHSPRSKGKIKTFDTKETVQNSQTVDNDDTNIILGDVCDTSVLNEDIDKNVCDTSVLSEDIDKGVCDTSVLCEDKDKNDTSYL